MRKNFPYLGHLDQCVAVFGQGSVRHPATFLRAFAILGHGFHIAYSTFCVSPWLWLLDALKLGLGQGVVSVLICPGH